MTNDYHFYHQHLIDDHVLSQCRLWSSPLKNESGKNIKAKRLRHIYLNFLLRLSSKVILFFFIVLGPSQALPVDVLWWCWLFIWMWWLKLNEQKSLHWNGGFESNNYFIKVFAFDFKAWLITIATMTIVIWMHNDGHWW